MLHWLAGQKAHENNADSDPTSQIEVPETPAPVFAVRAFKHAIFGTPQTVQPKPPRRHSNTETTRPKQSARPRMERPKSTNDAQTLGMDFALEEEPLPSPTKGILLTPGTATARRKTVSFGDQVMDNQGNRPLKSSSSADCPGKYPSPCVKAFVEPYSSDEAAGKPRGRSKLTEALEQVQQESARRKARQNDVQVNDEADVAVNHNEPQSKAGKYWKQEYDIYRERTTREVRKLVRRQKETKDYARKMDAECADLREELRQQQQNMERLEKRNMELEALLKVYRGSQVQKTDPETERDSSNEMTDDTRDIYVDARLLRAPLGEPIPATKPSRPARRSWKPQTDARDQGSKKPLGSDNSGIVTASEEPKPVLPVATMSRPRDISTRNQVDVLAQPLPSPSSSPQTKPPGIWGRPEGSESDTTPLKSLNVNTLAQDTRTIALSMGLQPPSPKREGGEKRRDSPFRSPELATRFPELSQSSMQARESSPFQAEAASERPNILTGAPVPIRSPIRTATKENVSPSRKPVPQESVKPSLAWRAMTGPGEQRRIVSKDNGQEIEQQRVEAAKARLAARGRQVS